MKKLATLTLADARNIIQAAIDQAAALKVPYTIAVVDVEGNLVAHARMDGAWTSSIEIAISKARIAGARAVTVDMTNGNAEPCVHWHGRASSKAGGQAGFGGGLPVKKASEIIGGVGASGGTLAQDESVVSAAVRAFPAGDKTPQPVTGFGKAQKSC
jgi:uncharacterized protein GlcG (DUF336 family)